MDADGNDKGEQLDAIMVAGRRIHAAVDAIDTLVSERLGVHRSDLKCLHLLENGPITPGEVAARTGLTSGSVTALLDRLEKAGFVERRRSCLDRRSVEAGIPDQRFGEVELTYDPVIQAVRECFSSEQAADIAEAARVLSRFGEALEKGARGLAAAARREPL